MLLDKVMWTDPTAAPAADLLSLWIEALDRAEIDEGVDQYG